MLALAIVFAVPLFGSTTATRQAVVVVGASLIAPFALHRLRPLAHLRTSHRVVLALAWGLALWVLSSGIVTSLTGTSSWIVSLYGYDGRGDGVLTAIAVAILLTAALTLTSTELPHLLTWVVVAATLSGIATLIQAVLTVGRRGAAGLPGLMGNSNFGAALSGIALILAIALAITAGQARRRSWILWTACAVVLAAAIVVAGPLQGPGSALAGLSVGALIAARVLWTGRTRIALWWAAAALAAGAATIAALGVLALGPLATIGDGPTVAIRRIYWQTAVNGMLAQPWFGMGPDSFVRVVSAYRPDAYLTLRTGDHHVTAAHDVPLQLGATVGIPGLLLWLGLMAAVVVIVVRALRRSALPGWPTARWIAAGLVGAWVAWLAQSLISIDQVALKALGWVLAGAVVAAVAPVANPGPTPSPSTLARWVTAGLAGLLVLFALIPPAVATSAADAARTKPQVRAALVSSWTSCPERSRLAREYADRMKAADAIGPLRRAWSLGPRCPGVGVTLAEEALRTGRPRLTASVSRYITRQDRLDVRAWILLAIADARLDRLPQALAAKAEAVRLAEIGQRRDYRDGLKAMNRAIRRAERRAEDLTPQGP